ncbi:hypothetical protein X801_06447 [Opisthorchis viverrini]|uniref:WD domain, G-beta repeat protein n=1 Tax=Opisthorchis viverrini TaxID=6198 RepID=A0A1S8WT90_OPIVI|nr:hypothetical protein X801_06447 [Opisthorchis viverrini]
MSAADRKAEIERKKATLIAIRENRKKREESRRSGLEDGSAAELGKVASNGDLGQTTEEILKTLGIPVGEEPVGTQNATDAQDSALAAAKTPTTTRKRKHLQFSRIIESSVPPPQSIQYSKEVQTIAQLSERESKPYVCAVLFEMIYLAQNIPASILTYEETSREEEDVDASAALAELQKMPHVGLSQTSQKGRTRLENGVAQEEVKKPVNLSEEDKTRILSSDDFIQFFNRSAQIIERAICEPEDALFLDYTGGEREAETSRELVTVCHEFFDERWSKRRVVTSLEWSTIYPELLLAAYHINEEAAHEPEGVCLIWNMKFPKKTSPEFIFHCQSPITSATLSKFHPNLVIGGTYSGQIVLWDSR